MKMISALLHKLDWVHVPVGVINAAVLCFCGDWGLVVGGLFGIGFLVYEVWESIKKGDLGWPEMKGYLTGLVMGAVMCRLIEVL